MVKCRHGSIVLRFDPLIKINGLMFPNKLVVGVGERVDVVVVETGEEFFFGFIGLSHFIGDGVPISILAEYFTVGSSHEVGGSIGYLLNLPIIIRLFYHLLIRSGD
jgi:hypothetical protein